jgi:hypothetical protein
MRINPVEPPGNIYNSMNKNRRQTFLRKKIRSSNTKHDKCDKYTVLKE